MNIKLPFIIDPVIKDKVNKFVNTSPDEFWVSNTYGNTINRKFCCLNSLNVSLTSDIKEYNKHVFSLLGLFEPQEEYKFGNFIGVNYHGGNVHPHVDTKNLEGWEHVRINFLISKPDDGGHPIVQGNVLDIEECYSWINIASRWLHSSTPVIGSKPRVVLSLGAYINPSSLENIGIN